MREALCFCIMSIFHLPAGLFESRGSVSSHSESPLQPWLGGLYAHGGGFHQCCSRDDGRQHPPLPRRLASLCATKPEPPGRGEDALIPRRREAPALTGAALHRPSPRGRGKCPGSPESAATAAIPPGQPRPGSDPGHLPLLFFHPISSHLPPSEAGRATLPSNCQRPLAVASRWLHL